MRETQKARHARKDMSGDAKNLHEKDLDHTLISDRDDLEVIYPFIMFSVICQKGKVMPQTD
jgi:hypothetical protein